LGEILQANTTNKEVMYAFRFMPSNKCIRLNQKQLDCIPYLAALVEHKEDFLSSQNENGEFVLNPPIHYTWFLAIFHSIISEQPYSLFTELPEDENILDTLQLFDYLGVNSFSSPLLKEKYLVLSNPTKNDNEKRRIEYYRANLSEARNTAAEFIIAIHKNEYNLLDSDTMETIFSLIVVILSKPDVFSSRFRHHTFTIVKEYCFQFFPTKKKYELNITHHRTQKQRKLNSFMYLYNENNSLPDNFDSAFAWKGVYMLPKEDHIQHEISYTLLHSWVHFFYIYARSPFRTYRYDFSETLRILETYKNVKVQRTRKKAQPAQSAQSKSFNTLPKRPNVDKFKHQYAPKIQKYR
jgi:hypothetical protein